MKKVLFIFVLSLYSIQGLASSCPDGSEPVKSVSDDGTYFVFNCAGNDDANSNNTSLLDGHVKASDIKFPGKFYTTKINSCKAMDENYTATFSKKSNVNKVKKLVGYDWPADHKANSNSMNVYHQRITVPSTLLMSATHNAIANNNQDNVTIAKNLLVDLAKADTLYDSIGYIEVKKKPGCYANGDINARCWYHEYQFARDVFSNLMMTALWLKDELNEQEFKVVDQYIQKMYAKFLRPIEAQKEEQGFYALANGGIPILVYSSWSDDKNLAAKEINHRFNEIDTLYYEDGYINNNSFRGYRSQWYHSYGHDSALGYVYVAKLWGANVPEKLQIKLVKASEVVNLAITDWDKFKSRKHSSENHNAIDDPANAIKHTHQMAMGLDVLMKIVTGIELERDPTYLSKRKKFMHQGIDELVGFNPHCI